MPLKKRERVFYLAVYSFELSKERIYSGCRGLQYETKNY